MKARLSSSFFFLTTFVNKSIIKKWRILNMTNKELYEKFIEKKNKKKLTYQEIADKLGTNKTNVFDKISRLKNNENVSYKFLIELEKVMEESIFFAK